jgi:putative endonuclease
MSKSGVLYIGVTSNLPKRIWEHKNKLVAGFTQRYKVVKLVYFEIFKDPDTAIIREKQLKRWRREKKVALIKTKNPYFKDLYPEIY